MNWMKKGNRIPMYSKGDTARGSFAPGYILWCNRKTS